MATKTAVPKKRSRSPARPPTSTGRVRTPRAPRTFRQYVAHRGSRWLARSWPGRRLRGTWRFGRAEVFAIRERRAAKAEGREPKFPTRRSVLAKRVRAGGSKVKAAVTVNHTFHCAGCGQDFTSDRSLRGHTCAQNHAPAAPPVAAATPAATKAAAPVKAAAKPKAAPAAPANATAPAAGSWPGHDEALSRAHGRRWRRANAEQRKADMTRGQRARDRAGRVLGRAMNRAGTCVACGWVVREGEKHDCQPAVNTAAPGAQPATPVIPAQRAAPSTKSPAPNGSGSPNGKGPTVASSNGTATAPGTAVATASSAAIVAAAQAWAVEYPETHEDMIRKMESTRQAFLAVAQQLEAFQQWMVVPRKAGGGGMHPVCAQPLTAASSAVAEASNSFTTVYMAIEQQYGAVLEHYRSGAPDPGAKYFGEI
jgi:hypothetical protein